MLFAFSFYLCAYYINLAYQYRCSLGKCQDLLATLRSVTLHMEPDIETVGITIVED